MFTRLSTKTVASVRASYYTCQREFRTKALWVNGSFFQSHHRHQHKFPFVAIVSSSSAALMCLILFQYDDNERFNTLFSRIASPDGSMTTTQLDVATVAVNENDSDTSTMLLNWSGTHAVTVSNENYYEPESVAEVEAIVAECHKNGQAVRPLGSALSPNAIGFNHEGMLCMSNLDHIVEIDLEKSEVTVQAGARVAQVVEALRPYKLTLPNLASIAEQQMGGFVQVGAHGTGQTVAPVDHYVTRLKIVTPARGTIVLTEEDGDIFHLAKVGLGCLGVVVEVTMQCIPAHRLVEHTFVLTREEAVERLDELLTKYKHMRYMWIPYTDAVVCVTNHPEELVDNVPKTKPLPEAQRFAPLRDLLKELTKDTDEPFTTEGMQGMGFGELRDALLAIDPLNIEHVKQVNAAEAEFWRRSSGYQVKASDQLLQFDCGGQVCSRRFLGFVNLGLLIYH